ncbi:MAG: FHA domain-containing protein [Gammaproteobacteria bacterium]|jgi:predicted component of type VI protein secretion system|nr:FHA domain-containing protein [Gammaproteobacteria bacterium]
MTAKLVLSLNGAVLREFPLNRERTTIGRRPENDIHIDNLAVSGQHALIITILNDSFLEDLGSTNGTYVNGRLVKKHALQHGDAVTIGKHELRYINEQASTHDSDFEKTMIIRPGLVSPASVAARHGGAAAALAERPTSTVHPHPAAAHRPLAAVATAQALTPAPAAAPPPATDVHLPLARIQVLNGPAAGKELELKKALTTLGKPGVQVAVITRRAHGYFITQVEGTRPLVNGQAIGAQAHPLLENDVIELAGVKMEFSFIG